MKRADKPENKLSECCDQAFELRSGSFKCGALFELEPRTRLVQGWFRNRSRIGARKRAGEGAMEDTMHGQHDHDMGDGK